MRITFAVPWTDDDGVTHKPDSTADISDVTARRLIGDGWARDAAPETPVAAPTSELPPPPVAVKPAQSTTESPATTGKRTEKE